MINFVQDDFTGGFRLDLDRSKLSDNQYFSLINGRSRFNTLQPIRKPVAQAGLPSGKRQACYAADRYGLVFIAGTAWYKDYSNPAAGFVQIPGFQMDATADYLYAELVPASTLNWKRTASDINSSIQLGSSVSGTPQAVVVQDGTNQPWLIFPDGTSRVSQNYNQWTTDLREYIPIGKQMAYVDGVLHVVAPDGKTYYRSVTGRPLDFVIAVNADGDKISTDEEVGGAVKFSLSVDYNDITCIAPANADDGTLLITTPKNSYLVKPNLTSLIFGEAKNYSNTPLFASGALNQFSAVELLGDIALIGYSGIQSFNAALSLKNEGKNSPFSSSVFSLLDGIVQSNPAAINFDDYGLFSVNTIYGNCVLVYDTIRQVFSGIDIYEGVGAIKMFAQVKVEGARSLLFITEDELYEAFASDEYETVTFVTKAFKKQAPRDGLKPEKVGLLFTNVQDNISGSFRWFVDNQPGASFSFSLTPGSPGAGADVPLPFTQTDNVKPIVKLTPSELLGSQVALYVTWQGNASLHTASLMLGEHSYMNGGLFS